MPLYHVVYEDNGELRNYCLEPMPIGVAQDTMMKFNRKYPGKPYPNRKGYYPFSPAWLEEV